MEIIIDLLIISNNINLYLIKMLVLKLKSQAHRKLYKSLKYFYLVFMWNMIFNIYFYWYRVGILIAKMRLCPLRTWEAMRIKLFLLQSLLLFGVETKR